jgi:hypothetical protein
MTRARLQRQVRAVVVAYAGALVVGIVLRIASSSPTSPGYRGRGCRPLAQANDHRHRSPWS